jgi:hypothetical protein
MNKQQQSDVNEKINYLRQMIDEAHDEGLHKIADLFAEELQTVLAMTKLDGNNSNKNKKVEA